MAWPWDEIVNWYNAAVAIETDKAKLQAQLAGMRMRR